MAGTGLPENKSRPVLAESPGIISGDRYSSAGAWGSIARSAEQVANTAGNLYGREVLQQQASVLAQEELDAQKHANDLREKHQFDPKGFETEWQAYTEGKLSQAPTFVVKHMKNYMGALGERNRNVVLNETSRRNTVIAGQTVEAGLKSTEADLVGLAMAGKVGSDEWKAVQAIYDGQLRTAVATKLMTTEMADLRTEQVIGQAQGEDAARSTLAKYEEGGYEAAAEHARKSILENDTLTLTPAQRQATYRRAIGALNQAKKEDAADRLGVIEESRRMREGIKNGEPYDMGTVARTAQVLLKHGAYHERNLLVREVEINKTNAPIKDPGLTIGEKSQYVRGLKTTAAGAAAIDQAAAETGLDVNMLRTFARIESGGNPNAVTGSYKGLFQMSEAEFKKYGGGNIFDPYDNARAAARKLQAESKQFFAAYGRPATAGDLYLVHQQGEAGYAAHLSNPTAPAWQNMASTGEGKAKGAGWAKQAIWGNIPDQDKARFGSVENVSSAEFVALWKAKATGGPVSVDPTLAAQVPFRPAVAEAQKAFVADAKKQFPQMQQSITAGRPPAAEDFEGMIYAASLSGDSKFMAEVYGAGAAIGLTNANASQPEKQAYVDSVVAKAKREGWDLTETSVVEEMEKTLKAQQTKLKEDMIGYHINASNGALKEPAPINFADSNSTVSGLAERSAMVQERARLEDMPVVSALRPADQQSLEAYLSTADPKNRARVFGDIAKLPENVRIATLAKLGEKGTTAAVESLAGALYAKDSAVATGILVGQGLTGEKSPFDPANAGQKYRDELNKSLPITAFSVSSRQTATGAYAAMTGAVRALYAFRSNEVGDVEAGKTINPARLERAVQDVTGGIVEHNGEKLITPQRKMAQDTFDAVLWSVAPKDLAGVTTLDGTPVTVDYLRNTAKLESYGDGRYMVRLGGDPERPIYAYQFANTEGPSPFILDLRGRQPGDERKVTARPFRGYQGGG